MGQFVILDFMLMTIRGRIAKIVYIRVKASGSFVLCLRISSRKKLESEAADAPGRIARHPGANGSSVTGRQTTIVRR